MSVNMTIRNLIAPAACKGDGSVYERVVTAGLNALYPVQFAVIKEAYSIPEDEAGTCDMKVRLSALLELGRTKATEAALAIVIALTSDPNAVVRAVAARALGFSGVLDENTHSALMDFAINELATSSLGDPDVTARKTALESLGKVQELREFVARVSGDGSGSGGRRPPPGSPPNPVSPSVIATIIATGVLTTLAASYFIWTKPVAHTTEKL